MHATQEVTIMPPGQQYPPHQIPGLDKFLKNPGPLHDITITQASTEHPYNIDVRATATHPHTHEEIPLGIYWKPGKRGGADTLHASVGDRHAAIEHGATSPERLAPAHLGSGWPEIWEPLNDLWAIYRQARRIQGDYLAAFEEYLLARIDAAAGKSSRPGPARLARLQNWKARP
jgi:hypothetical protein